MTPATYTALEIIVTHIAVIAAAAYGAKLVCSLARSWFK